MSDALPAPLVPLELDLRGLEFMPLFGDRLFGSQTWITASDAAKVAALRLWWRSFAHEVPASSLPDDDRLLAEYAGYGVSVRAWQRVKAQAMRGWVKCSDGRWYHPFVAEEAAKAWAHRVRNRNKQRKFREKAGAVTVTNTVTGTVTKPLQAGLQNGCVTPDRTGQDRTERKDTAEHNPAREPDPDAWRQLGERCCAAAGLDTGRLAVDFRAVTGWLEAGFDPERDILTTIRAIAGKPGYQPPGGLAYFTKPIAETNRQRRNPLPANLDRRPKPAASPPPQASEVYAAMGLGSVRKIDAKAENLTAGAKVEPIGARGSSINEKAIQGAKK